MAKFRYKGRDKKGAVVHGSVEAQSEAMVAQELVNLDITPINVSELSNDFDVIEFFNTAFGIGRPCPEDIIIFCKQMNTMMKAGVPLIRSLKIIQEATKNKNLNDAIRDLVISLESGHSLSQGMGQHPIIFSSLAVAMIDVGENTGNLDAAFDQLAKYMEKDLETSKRIKSATRYPITVFATIFVAIGIINIFVVPAFKKFFDSFDSELPLPTRILVGCSDFMLAYWPILVILIIGSCISFGLYIHTEDGERFWGRLKLKIPFIGSILERSVLSRFCQSLSMTSKAGVPIMEAISVVSSATDNRYICDKVLLMRQGLERGEAISVTAKASGIFTPLVMQMIVIGEETGNLDDMLLEVSDYYEREVDYDLKRLSDAIEPLLIGIVAGMVLVLALGVFLPMWDLSSVAMHG